MCTPGTIHLRKHTQQPHNNLEPYTQNTHPYTTHTGIRHSSFLCGVCSHPLRLKFKRTRLLIEVCRQKAHQKHLVDIQSGIWCCHYEQHARAWSVFAGGVVSGLELDVHIRGGHYCWYVDVLMCWWPLLLVCWWSDHGILHVYCALMWNWFTSQYVSISNEYTSNSLSLSHTRTQTHKHTQTNTHRNHFVCGCLGYDTVDVAIMDGLFAICLVSLVCGVGVCVWFYTQVGWVVCGVIMWVE